MSRTLAYSDVVGLRLKILDSRSTGVGDSSLRLLWIAPARRLRTCSGGGGGAAGVHVVTVLVEPPKCAHKEVRVDVDPSRVAPTPEFCSDHGSSRRPPRVMSSAMRIGTTPSVRLGLRKVVSPYVG